MSFWPCQRRPKITCIVRAKWLWGTYSCCQGRIHSALVAQKLMSLIACHDTEADCLPCAIWPFLVNGPAYMINVASWTFGTLLFSVLKVTRSFEGQKKLFIICCHVQVCCNHHLHRDCHNLRDWVNLLSLAIRLSEPPLCHVICTGTSESVGFSLAMSAVLPSVRRSQIANVATFCSTADWTTSKSAWWSLALKAL